MLGGDMHKTGQRRGDYDCALPGQSNISHQEQMTMWQQDSYLNEGTDSGVVSGALSVATRIDDDLLYDWDTNSNGLGSQFSGSVPMDQGMELGTQRVHQTGSQRSAMFPSTIDDQMEISSSPFPNQGDFKMQMLSEVQMHPEPNTEVLPRFVKMLNDEDQLIVSEAISDIHRLSNFDSSVNGLIKTPQMIASIVKAMRNSNDAETTRCAAGALQNISLKEEGRHGIFQADGIRALVELLSSPLEGVVFYVITTLHNMLLHLKGCKNAVRNAGGLQKMVSLLQRNNPKFLTIVTDCLQILSYGNSSAKLTILASGGPSELLRILRSFDYEKLLWTTTRVLKVLSVCSSNKPAIIEAGGVEVLTMHLNSNSSRLVINCLFAIRNLSDAAIPQENIEELLHGLVRLLASQNVDIVTCAAGALSNLTCNNQRNKSIVYKIGGIKALMHAVFHAGDREEITEPAICCLRHLTCRYPEAEMSQQVIRESYGVDMIVKLLQDSRLPLKKAVIGLIRNLALQPENHELFRQHNVMPMMMGTLQRATTELMNSIQNMAPMPVIEGVKVVEIIDGILGAFTVLSKNSFNLPVFRNMGAATPLVRLFYAEIDTVTRLAALVLNELASDRDGVMMLNAPDIKASLETLSRYPNQMTAGFASQLLGSIQTRLMSMESQSRFGFG